MPRGLDHIVHAVRDLDAAVDVYRKLGFTVGAHNRHPWGTHNHIVQFPGFFIEILTVAEPNKLGDDGFSKMFGDFNRRFLEQHDGFSLLILESKDASTDERAFALSHIAASPAMRFEREGKRPDGSPVTVAFSLAFARDPLAPEIGFAVSEQHFPENFWSESLQQHANGVTDVAGAVMVADNPSDHHIFLSAFTGERDLQSTSAGITVTTPRGEIQVMTPASYADHFDVMAPDIDKGARLAALRLICPDLSVVEASLSAGRIEAKTHMGRLIVPPRVAHGAAIIFEAAATR